MPDPVAMLVSYLGITARFARRIAEAGVGHPADLADWQPDDLSTVRQLGTNGETEVTGALERRLGMTCGSTWSPPPALLRDPAALAAAIANAGAKRTAARLRVHVDAVTTWAALHAHIAEPESPRERRPDSASRARAILDAGIPVTGTRRQLLLIRAGHPDRTTREIAAELGWTRTEVQRAWARAMLEHPPEAVARYRQRDGS